MAQQSTGEDLTLSFAFANLIALLMIPISLLLFVVPFLLIWGLETAVSDQTLRSVPWVWLLLLFVGSIVVHELLHAVGYTAVGKIPWTHIQFGFSWKGLAPYAHCEIPLKASAYRVAVWLPGVVLGVIPGIIGLIIGQWGWILYALLMLISAGGDFAVLYAIRQVDADDIVQDHPSQVGCRLIHQPDYEITADY